MQTTFKLFFSCLFCFSLTLLSGCGGGAPSLTSAERAEIDPYLEKHGTSAIIHYLMEPARTWMMDEEGWDSRRQWVDAKRLKYTKYLAFHGADVNAKGNLVFEGDDPRDGFLRTLGITPLHFAAIFGDVELAKFLVSRGAGVNANAEAEDHIFGRESVTPLDAARHTAMIEYLKSVGAKAMLPQPEPPPTPAPAPAPVGGVIYYDTADGE